MDLSKDTRKDTRKDTSWQAHFGYVGGIDSYRPSHARRMLVVAGRLGDEVLLASLSGG
jgi:hypothetical protein